MDNSVPKVPSGTPQYGRSRKMIEVKELDALKSDLLSIVAHELRTPLAVIEGCSTLLVDYDCRLTPEEKRKNLEAIVRAANRLNQVVDRLLGEGRLDPGLHSLNRELADVEGLVLGAVAEARLRWPEHHFRVECERELPRVEVDVKRVRQVMVDLLDNAARYSGKGTEIVVRAIAGEQWVRISVADQGRGMATGDAEKVFDPMYVPKQCPADTERGPGLGLPLARGLVQAHGGRIWLESEPGRGTTAYFVLPVKTAD